MLAINLANYLARLFLKEILKRDFYQQDSTTMYYETQAIFELASTAESLAKLKPKSDSPLVLFYDINNCSLKQNQSFIETFKNRDIPVVVLDYTSATTTDLSQHIGYSFQIGTQLVLLVNSGLKNEQFGADNNPYGTIRIVSQVQDYRDFLYDSAISALEKVVKLPPASHSIRKFYKQKGFVMCTQFIKQQVKFELMPKYLRPLQQQASEVIEKIYGCLETGYSYKVLSLVKKNVAKSPRFNKDPDHCFEKMLNQFLQGFLEGYDIFNIAEFLSLYDIVKKEWMEGNIKLTTPTSTWNGMHTFPLNQSSLYDSSGTYAEKYIKEINEALVSLDIKSFLIEFILNNFSGDMRIAWLILARMPSMEVQQGDDLKIGDLFYNCFDRSLKSVQLVPEQFEHPITWGQQIKMNYEVNFWHSIAEVDRSNIVYVISKGLGATKNKQLKDLDGGYKYTLPFVQNGRLYCILAHGARNRKQMRKYSKGLFRQMADDPDKSVFTSPKYSKDLETFLRSDYIVELFHNQISGQYAKKYYKRIPKDVIEKIHGCFLDHFARHSLHDPN